MFTQVAPAELEDVIRSLSGVKDVAVIGVKSEREGEVPRAYIVRSATNKVDLDVSGCVMSGVTRV